MEIKVIASGSTGNAYIVDDGSTKLLLDAGVPFPAIQRGAGYRTRDIKGCLITHAHGDHSKAASEVMRRCITVYTSAGTIAACGLTGYRAHAIKSMERAKVGTFTVMAFDVKHDAPEPLGFLIRSNATGEKLLYFTDTYYLEYRFTGITHILGECNYTEAALAEAVTNGTTPEALAKRIIKSHMSLETFLGFIRANDMSRVRQIYLLHLSESHSSEAEMKNAVRAATGAEVYTV